MHFTVTIPPELSRSVFLAVLSDCVDHAAMVSVCTNGRNQDDADAYLAAAYHLRKAIRAAQSEAVHPVIDGLNRAAVEAVSMIKRP